MKKFVCLLLALVLILALAGCKVSSRPYRRYSAPYGTDNGSYRTYDGTYRTNTRTANPGDASQYNDYLYRTGSRGSTTGRTAVPSPVPTTGTAPNRTNRPFNVPS